MQRGHMATSWKMPAKMPGEPSGPGTATPTFGEPVRCCSGGRAVCVLSCVRLLVTPWTVACQAPLSVEFYRQEEYWRGLLFPPPGYLPDPGIKPLFPVSPALAGEFFTTSAPWEVLGGRGGVLK